MMTGQKWVRHDPGKLRWNRERAVRVRSHRPAQRVGNGASELLGARLAKHALFVLVPPAESRELVPCWLPAPLAYAAPGSLINHDGLTKIVGGHGYSPLPALSAWVDVASQRR